MSASDKETEKEFWKGVVLFLVALVTVPAVLWIAAWKFESLNFDEGDRKLNTNIAMGYLCEEVVSKICSNFAGSQPMQEYQTLKVTNQKRIREVFVAARRAFVFPDPELGLLLIIALGLLGIRRANQRRSNQP